MKVSVEYAQQHFADILSAASDGECVEISLTGKPAVLLTLVSTNQVNVDDAEVWHSPERPRSELFGSLKGKFPLADDWDSPEMNKQVERLFEESEVFPDTLRG